MSLIPNRKANFAPLPKNWPPAGTRDIFVNHSPLFRRSVVTYVDEFDNSLRRTPACMVRAAGPTRINYENSTQVMKFSDKLMSTIVEVKINLFLQQDENQTDEGGVEENKEEKKDVATQLAQLWHLISTFPRNVRSLMVRLAEPDCYELHNKEKIVEDMIYDDSVFFDLAKVKKLCRLFDRLELHVKCNAIQKEHIPELIEFFHDMIKPHTLLIYISEFKLYLDSIGVTESNGHFKSTNPKVKVTQVGWVVTLRIDDLSIRFEDEFCALRFRNFDFDD